MYASAAAAPAACTGRVVRIRRCGTGSLSDTDILLNFFVVLLLLFLLLSIVLLLVLGFYFLFYFFLCILSVCCICATHACKSMHADMHVCMAACIHVGGGKGYTDILCTVC